MKWFKGTISKMRHCFEEKKIYPDMDIYILDLGRCRYRLLLLLISSQYLISTQPTVVLINVWPVLDAVGEGFTVRTVFYLIISVDTYFRNLSYFVLHGQFYCLEINFNYRETHSHKSLYKQSIANSAF